MSIPPWHEEPIAKSHDREGFDCGDEALNEFLAKHARKSHERGGAKTFVAVEEADNRRILGFYTLSPVSLAYARTPAIVKRGLARHEIPGFRLGRLGVDHRCQGKGLGGQLLLAAGRRCLLVAEEVGGVAVVIDAKNEGVAHWYSRYGAIPLEDSPLTLILPLATMNAALQSANGR